MQTLEFTCPHCGHHRLEEVKIGVTVSTIVGNITLGKYEEGELHHCYGVSMEHDGETHRYQCYDCSNELRLEQKDMSIYKVTKTVTNLEELARWFEQNKG